MALGYTYLSFFLLLKEREREREREREKLIVKVWKEKREKNEQPLLSLFVFFQGGLEWEVWGYGRWAIYIHEETGPYSWLPLNVLAR